MVTKVPLGSQTSGTSDDITEGSTNLFLSVADQAKLDNIPADTNTSLSAKVDKTTTVNGHALSSNVTVTASDVGLGNVDNTSDANKPVSTATQTALDAKQSTSEKGVANGYASLDATGKVPGAQLPAGIGTGNVLGPASSTDNAIARFDSTTGNLLQNSSASIDDNGNLTANNYRKILTNPDCNTITTAGSYWMIGTPTNGPIAGEFALQVYNDGTRIMQIGTMTDSTVWTRVYSGTWSSWIKMTHDLLSGLSWATSGHTGTASNIAGFDGSGLASQYTLSGTGTVLPTTASPTFTGTVTTPAIKITTGATNGYVGTSDADGNLVWTAPGAGGLITTADAYIANRIFL